MIIWAIFLCIPSRHTCERSDPGRITLHGEFMPGQIFKTKAACERMMPHTGGRARGETYFECKSRYVETWR